MSLRLPSGVVERLSRYAVHAKVTSDQTTIMFEDRPLDDQQASDIIQHFNDAIFIERYYIYPGDEERFSSSAGRACAAYYANKAW
ncbi:YfmQ family protein [Bacillus sp. SL00103]